MILYLSVYGVQELLDAVTQTGARYGMELHWNKFQLLQIGAVYHLVTPDGSVIPPSEVMTYLGTAIYADGSIKRELNRKLGRAWAEFSKARLWNHASLRKERKILMYKAVVVSRLLYGLNTAWLNVAEQRRLNGFHCRCLRKIVGIPSAYISRVSNVRVLKEAQEAPLERQLLRQQLLLYGRLIRAPSADPLRKLLSLMGWTSRQQRCSYVNVVGHVTHGLPCYKGSVSRWVLRTIAQYTQNKNGRRLCTSTALDDWCACM